MNRALNIFAALTILFFSACGHTTSSGNASPETWFPLTLGGKKISVQLALNQAQWQKGLMGRPTLGPDKGMLFVFNEPTSRTFWMKDTPLPLELGYFTADGVLRELHLLYPYNMNSVRSRRTDILIALEMNQGWFIHNQVLPGATLDMEALRKAIRDRGLNPEEFGL